MYNKLMRHGWILVSIVAISVVGCGGFERKAPSDFNVQIGWTKDQVEAKFGEVAGRDESRWTYRFLDEAGNGTNVFITFDEKEIVKKVSYGHWRRRP